MLGIQVVASAVSSVAAAALTSIAEVEVDRQQPAGESEVVDGKQRPSIVLIMLDDMGFADTSVFGGLAYTPRLQDLAASGLRYNRFHTAGVCSPTRAALLSGRNHHRVGFGENNSVQHPGYDGIWKKNTAPIAEILRRSGYSTAAFGKWHNTPHREITPIGPFDRWPTGLGFEYFYGNMLGKSSQWEPPLWRNTLAVAQPFRPSQGYHLTADLVDDAIRWIQTHDSLDPDKPYFVYFATGAAHTPHHVPKEWTMRYRGSFDDGWDVLRRRVFTEQKKLGVIPKGTELTSRPKQIAAWEELSKSEREFAARQMEQYAGFISHTDDQVGRLIRTVQQGPRGDNTLIMYILGDNGGDYVGGRVGEGWSQGTTSLVASPSMPSEDMSERGAAYAQGWAWLGSTPFKWMKVAASHFGATRNPMIVSWPSRIKDSGGLRSQFSHVVDIAPTLLEVAGVEFPTSIDGVEQIPFSGVSLGYSFDNQNAESRHGVQYFEVGGNRAIYRDGWVAAALHLDPALFFYSWRGQPGFAREKWSDFSRDKWELYNVAEDFSQARDLSGKYPDVLDELRALFDEEALDNGVYPLGIAATGEQIGQKEPTRREYVYHNGFPGAPIASSPSDLLPDFSVSHQVTADVFITHSTEGVIFAAGGRDGGLVLFVKDGRLVFETNQRGRLRRVNGSIGHLPSGILRLAYRFYVANPESVEATVELIVNAQSIGSGTVNVAWPSVLDNFDVGQDSAAPVSTAYESPFRFSGMLRTLVIKVDRTIKTSGA